MQTGDDNRTRILWRIGWALVLIAATAPYLPAMGGMLVWDDRALVGAQRYGSLLGCFTRPFLSSYYRPMVSATFFLDGLVWRDVPFGYHQTNLIIHVATAAILVFAAHAAFGRRSIAILCGLLFALQPAQVSAVAWIGGRTDSLCALFVSAMALALIYAAHASGRRQIALSAAAVALYFAAILTKEQILVLLPLIPYAFYAFAPARTPSRRVPWDRRRAALTTLAAAIVAAIFVLLWTHFAPVVSIASALNGGRAARFGRTITYYAALLVAPTPRTMHTFSLGSLESAGAPTVLLGYAIAGAALAAWIWLHRRSTPAAWFAALTILAIAPVSNLLTIPTFLVAPYRAGVAGIGVAVIVGWISARAWDRRRAASPFASRCRAAGAACLIVAVLGWHGALTLWGAPQWKDERTAYRTIVREDPYSMIARINLAAVLDQLSENGEARANLEALLQQIFGSDAWRFRTAMAAAMRTDPRILGRIRDSYGPRAAPGKWLVGIYADLGSRRLQCGDLQAAKIAYDCGAAIDPGDTDNNVGLADCAAASGDRRYAERFLRTALKSSPDSLAAHYRLGKVMADLGRWREARDEFAFCVRAQPWIGQATVELARVQQRMGDRTGAAKTLRAALALSPNRKDLQQMLRLL